MTKEFADGNQYSRPDLEKIRKRAREIWKRKCHSLNTALDDWLQAERELMAPAGIGSKKPDRYTPEDVSRIKERAQAIRDEKIQSLRTAFDDWIQAEQEFKEELEKKINVHDLFDLWFNPSFSRITEVLKKNTAIDAGIFNDILEQQYVELMAKCMT